MAILDQLGIDFPKIIAQIIIFGIVYGILSKYAFGPVTALLEERRSRIAAGEANLDKIKENLSSSEAQAAAALAKANAEATRLIKEASDAAAAIGEQKKQDAVAEAQSIIAKAKEATELERARVMAELKRDFGRLVIDTTSKVTGKTLGSDDHARLNQEALAQISM
jgi:F-type H+-transporting ATPase subunit b